MRVDFATRDAGIILAADNKTGLWAFSKITNRLRTIRNGGQLPTEASRHMLLTTALTVALTSYTKSNIDHMMYNAPHGVEKPRVIVLTLDSTFGPAVQGMLAESTTSPRLRAGRNLISVLKQQMKRFDVEFYADARDKDAFILSAWVKETLIDPKVLKRIPPALLPTAVSQLY
jgi:hypothetical protein